MEGKFEIAAIPNKYKNTLDDLIYSSDIDSADQPTSSNWLRPMKKGIRNAPRFRNASASLSEEEKNCLDEDILVTLLELTPKIQNSQVYICYNVAPLGSKSLRVQYGENQRGKKDGKDERGRENGSGKRGKRGHRGNKINVMVGKSSSSEVSVYHHIAYPYYQKLMVLG